MKEYLCIYHSNCADGFTAAWVVRRAYGEDHVEFYPGVYSTPPPDVAGRHVIMVDFSYKRPVMEYIVREAESVVVLDHHESAQRDLQGLVSLQRLADPEGIDCRIVFDMERCGAMIAWEYFFPQQSPPQLLRHIEDRDLWRFSLPGTREIQATVFSYEYTFENWDRLMRSSVRHLAEEGAAIERKHHKDVRELSKVVTRLMMIGGCAVPVANVPYTLTSDMGHLLAEPKQYPFAACYWDTPEGRVFSLRSREEGANVAEIAEQYGGGGHAHAAGFTVPWARVAELGLV